MHEMSGAARAQADADLEAAVGEDLAALAIQKQVRARQARGTVRGKVEQKGRNTAWTAKDKEQSAINEETMRDFRVIGNMQETLEWEAAKEAAERQQLVEQLEKMEQEEEEQKKKAAESSMRDADEASSTASDSSRVRKRRARWGAFKTKLKHVRRATRHQWPPPAPRAPPPVPPRHARWAHRRRHYVHQQRLLARAYEPVRNPASRCADRRGIRVPCLLTPFC